MPKTAPVRNGKISPLKLNREGAPRRDRIPLRRPSRVGRNKLRPSRMGSRHLGGVGGNVSIVRMLTVANEEAQIVTDV